MRRPQTILENVKGRQNTTGTGAAAVMIALAIAGLSVQSQAQDGGEEEKKMEATTATTSSAGEWSSTDTKLANHYIGLLQAEPEFGNVLDLLWKLYEKRDSTQVLLDYIGGAAANDEEGTAKLLHGHLLRKSGDADAAAARYGETLKLQPENVHALRGAAELAATAGKPAKSLAYYNRLIPLLPLPDQLGADIRMRKASMLEDSGDIDAAVDLWLEVLGAFPDDLGLRTEVVGLLLEANRVEGAVSVLREMLSAEDPGLKVFALQELNRLYEFIADFAGAASAAREGLALAHYKHHIYADFFGRLVRLHERFGRLEELEQQLLEDAEKGNPTEESVYVLGEFYRLTANPLKREIWLARLVELVPGNPAYRSDLAHTQIANDHYEAAAKTVDDLLATGAEGDLPLPLVLLRTRIELNLGGKEGAAAYLEKYLQRGEPTGEALRKVLAFSRENYLDGVVEDLLRGPLAEDGLAAKDDAPSAVRLATFLRERGRLKQAKETLEEYVAEAGDDVRRKGQRLEQAAAAYREMDLPDEALEKIRESIALAPDRLDLEVQRAEILVVQQDIKGAMIAYESVWRRSATIEEKTEIDQRLFSLLRGLDDDPSVPSPASMQPPPLGSSPATMAQFRRRQMTAAATLAGGGGGIGPAGAEAVPRELLEFYEGLKKVALEEPTVANRYRVAWWAFRQQDHTEMYHQLAGLHDPDNPILEVEKLMLELAEQTENTLLMARKLELLAQIDIDNQTEYRQRWAEVRFKLGYEDEAVRLLEELASDPDASLSTLKALAGVYKEQARNKDQVEVWRKAYLRGNVFEKRRVIKQLTTTLIEMGEPGQAMAAQMDLIERETDMVQKRKLFDAQLSLANRQYLLGELLETYMELSQQSPFERFYPEALARIYRAMDDSDAAFKAMKKAYYMSGEDRELLAELGEMAGETSDLKAAIYYRRQLISKDDGEGTDAESWKALIGMLERDLRVQEADRIRRRLEGKFAQDADFLQSMAEYYQSTGQGVSAARVLEELVRLRPWDGQAQLELGLLRRDAGDLKGALAAFESTIEATAEAALSAQERDFEYLPLVDGGWYSGVGTRPVNGGLSNIVRGMQDYHYTPLDLQEEMLNRFQRPHPEFHRVPGGDSFLRLRAIEEAARLVAAGVGIEVAEGAEGPSATDVEDARDAWVRRWDRSGEVSPTERLWAFFHVGDHLAAHRLLKERMLPVFRAPDQFDFLYLSLRMGRHQEVIDWLKEERLKPAEDQGDPSTLPMIATFLLLREGQDEEAQLSDEVLVALLGELTVSPRLLDHLVEQLMHNGTIGSAYRLASAALSTEAVGVDIDRCYRASKLAHWLGMEQQREEWLVRAVEVMALRPVRSGRTFSAGWVLPATFYQVTAERMSLLEAGAQRDEFRSGVMAQLEKMPGVGEDMILEAEALLAFADGEAQKGMGFLARLMARRSSGGRSRELVEDSRTDSIFRREFWMLSERIVNQLAMTVPHGAPSGAFYAAFQPLAQRSRSGDEEVDAQFEQFEIARFAWLLEGMAPAERLSRVALFSDGLLDESSRMELVHTLESRGFYRDVVPLYDRLIAEQPDDFTLVRGFFQACREARDHEAGLEMLGRFLNGELPRAAGMTDGYLVTEHAHFLEMARDVEQLATFAQSSGELIGKGDAGDAEGDTTAPLSPAALLAKVRVAGGFSGETGGAGDWSGVYHAALARVQEQRGDTDAALRVYEHLRQKEILDLGDRLEAVDLLIVEGKYEEARSWLADVSFDRIQPGVEANALRKLVQLNAREGQRDVEKLEALARTALDYGDVDLVGDVAATLHEAGLAAEADSLLLLRARQAQSAQERSRLLLRMLIVAPETESKLKSGTEPVSVAWVSRSEESRKAALLVLLDTLQPEDPATLEWLTAVKALAADDGGGGGGGADADAMRVQLQEMAVEMASNSLPLELAGLLLETDRDAVDVRGRVANWSVAGRELAALVLPEESVWMEALGESLAAESVVPQLFSSPGDLQRRIQVLARLGLDEQLENLHRHLLLETAGGGLLRRMAVDEALTFELRWPLPAVFAESGRRDLAADLYRHYFEALPRLTRGHGEFLDGYARFLIEEKRWVDAENLLQLLFQKSLGGDTQLLVELFDGQTGSSEEAAADDAGDWQQFLKKFSLSSGEMVDLAARREN